MIRSSRRFTDQSARGMRSRRGFAMFMALGALVIIGVLIAGSSFLSLQETHLGQNQIVETRAFTAAEFGLNKIQMDWDKTPNMKMANGASFDTTYLVNARDTARVRYTRLNDETFWRVSKRSDVALRYGASVEQDTSSDAEANAPFRGRWRVARPERWSELPWSSGS